MKIYSSNSRNPEQQGLKCILRLPLTFQLPQNKEQLSIEPWCFSVVFPVTILCWSNLFIKQKPNMLMRKKF